MSVLNSVIHGDDRPDLLKEETLAGIFKATAARFPHHPALVFNQKVLTYQQLDRWSDAFAAELSSQGIGRGSFVGIWWPRSLELHVAILGIIKAGAAYVPLDREMPAERVATVMNEVGAAACISDALPPVSCPVIHISPFEEQPGNVTSLSLPEPDDYAYVLYTSGSTGTPKGIPITQRQICHLVRAENVIIQVQHEDKVYQGFSVSFDMWCEETWISYLVGATLYVADATTAKSIDELDVFLSDNGITVLHAVPSLLAVMEDNIPSVRLINAGGEACTPQVLNKWAKPSRRFFNSYGPTETTVTATMLQLQPGDAITIGSPLPNYNIAVIDDQFRILPAGERGELVISGPGVCNGYINRPDLTRDKFLEKPASMAELPGTRFYRSGDAAIINADGTIDFQGRLDDQIKLRGYRIELGEIEVKLNQQPGIAAAAVAVKKDGNDQDTLVGYVVMEPGHSFDETLLRTGLANVLPPYMVPGAITRLPEMPRLPSGKINRKALPVPASLLDVALDTGEDAIAENAPLDERVLFVLHKVFPNRTITLDQDFFTDLGGHSLLAAVVVSKLRKEAGIPQASLKDIYTARPLSAVVAMWAQKETVKATAKEPFHEVPRWRYYTCFAAQTAALLVIYAFYAAQIFFPYLGYYYTQQITDNHGYALLTALGGYCLIPPTYSMICVIVKWLVIGKMKEGDYPLWGTYYFRWWFVKAMQRISLMQFLNGTPLYNTYLRRLGVKVAPDAQLSNMTIGAEDLVTIGADASLSSNVVLNNAWVENGWLKLRKIHIGDHAYLGSSAVVGGDTVIEDWGELQDLSYLPSGKTIRKAEVWTGSPAQYKSTMPEHAYPHPLPVGRARRRIYRMIFSALLLIFPFVVLLPLLPVLVILNDLDNSTGPYDFSYLWITPVLSLLYITLFGLVTVVSANVLQKGIKPGKYPIYSLFYVRKWFADQILSLCLVVLHPIYATVFVSSFFRALGAKIGKHTEISTASSVTHPLLKIGNGSFIADAVTLGEADVRGQQLILEETVIGNSSFVGNSALIPQGYHLPDNMLIGVLSTPPVAEQLAASDAKDYFGSPAIALPRRQESQAFSDQLTLYPSFGKRLFRSAIELIRILIPETVVFISSVLFIAYLHDLIKNGIHYTILYLPLYYLFFIGIPCFLVTVLLKWVTVGKYRSEQHPMWTHKVWRSEAITTTYEALAVPYFLEYLKGTPWLPILLRLFGVKTGKRVWMNTADVTEFDMVTIGDDVALNDDCGPQTHLFEDRVMKIGSITIGNRCSVGARSIILYDSEVGNDVQLDALSLVMKGEKLPDSTVWTGSPVKNA